MERRRLLHAFTTALAGTTLAGCSDLPSEGSGDGDGTGGDGDEDGTDTATPTTSVQDYLNVAVGKLNTVALAFASVQQELEAGNDVSYDPADDLERIDAARAALENAKAGASGDRASDVEGLLVVADAMEATARAIDTSFAVRDSVGRLGSLAEERDFETALSTLEDPKQRVGEAKSNLDASVSEMASLDEDAMNETNLRFTDIEAGVVEVQGIVDSFYSLLVGYEAMFEGGVDLQTARQRSEDGDYEAAAASFGTAATSFETAETTFSDGVGDAEPIVKSHYETAACQSTHLKRAAQHFEEAAKAAAKNDVVTARDEREKAEEQLAAFEDC